MDNYYPLVFELLEAKAKIKDLEADLENEQAICTMLEEENDDWFRIARDLRRELDARNAEVTFLRAVLSSGS